MIAQELLTKLGFVVDPSGLKKGEDQLSRFKGFVAKLAIGASVAAVGVMAIRSAAQMETLNAQFTTMLGSAEAAADMMAKMNDFAARTPFETMDIANAGQTLLGFGIQAKDVMSTVEMLGNVAGANAQRFSALSLVYGQIQSTGRLMGQDLLQLINAGFNPLKIISEQTGRSMGQLKKDMEDGKISAKAVELAFKIATSEGGLFYKNLENQSKTFQGVWSTMMDNIRMSLTKAIMPFMATIKLVLTALGQIDLSPIVNVFEQLSGKTDDWGSAVQYLGQLLVNLVAQGLQLFVVLQAWIPTFKQIGDILQVIYPLFVAIFGLQMLSMIKATALGTRIAAAANLFMQRASLAAGAAAGYQATMTTVASTAMYTLRTAAIGAGAAMKTAFLGLLNPLTLGLTAIIGIWMVANKIKKDFRDELKKEQDAADDSTVISGNADYQEKLAQKELAFQQAKIDKMRALNQKGAQIDREELARAVKARDNAKQILEDIAAARKRVFGEEGASDISAVVSQGAAGAVGQVQSQLSTINKNANIKNELNLAISAPGDSNGKGKSRAEEIARLAAMHVRAEFSVMMKEALVGTL